MHPFLSGISGLRACLRYLLTALLAIIVTASLQYCKKEKSYEGGFTPPTPGLPPQEVVKSEWRFTEDRNRFFGPVDTAFLVKEGIYTILTLSGKSQNGSEAISMRIKTTDASIQKGKTYKTTAFEASFVYRRTGDTLYRAIPMKGGDMAVTVTDVSDTKIIATFKGLAVDKADRSYFITEGFISSPIKKGPLSNNGYIMLWARKGCNGPIRVKVNGLAGEISQFYYNPDCDEPGTALFHLPPGTYKWVAYCGKDSLEGQEAVQTGRCTKVFVNFPFIPSAVTGTVPQKTCKLSELYYRSDLENDSRAKGNDVISEFTGATIHNIKYYAGPAPVILDHPVSYSGDSIILNENSDIKQYFLLDAKKRVVEFGGIWDPTSLYPVDYTLVKYTYNSGDELIKRQVFHPRYRYLILETDYTWMNGNIVATTERNAFNTSYTLETYYKYYSKEVKAFPFVDFNAFELVFYQSLFSFGKSCKNPPRERTIISTTGSNLVYTYDSYIIDNNNYVLSCRLTNESREKSTNFTFTYKCF